MAYQMPVKNVSNTGAAASQNVSTGATPPAVNNVSNVVSNGANGAPGVASPTVIGFGPQLQGALGQVQGAVGGALGQVQNVGQMVNGMLSGISPNTQWPTFQVPNFDISGLGIDQIRPYVENWRGQLMTALGDYRNGIMGIVNQMRGGQGQGQQGQGQGQQPGVTVTNNPDGTVSALDPGIGTSGMLIQPGQQPVQQRARRMTNGLS